tara:strand:+ start:88 stop:309 length:222 start_codon:yes stop_codon:yes gene_type:complete
MTLLKLEFFTSTFVFFVVCFVVREAHKQNNTLAELITSREVGSAALLSVAILAQVSPSPLQPISEFIVNSNGQ